MAREMSADGRLILRSHVERSCSILGPAQSRISPSILQYTEINGEIIARNSGWQDEVDLTHTKITFEISRYSKNKLQSISQFQNGAESVKSTRRLLSVSHAPCARRRARLWWGILVMLWWRCNLTRSHPRIWDERNLRTPPCGFAAHRRGNNLKAFQDVHPKATIGIWL